MRIGKQQAATRLLGLGHEDAGYFGLRLADNCWAAGLDDTRFLVSDLRQCLAQNIGVIVTNVSNHRNQRVDNVS